MSIAVPVLDKSDPRVDKLYPYHLPVTPEWEEKKDFFGQSAMMGAGAGMFIKNPLFVWASMAMGVASYVSYEALRAPKDGMSPLITMGMGLSGVIATSFPKMLIAGESAPAPPAGAVPQ